MTSLPMLGFFDLVTSISHSLNHLPGPDELRRCLEEAARVDGAGTWGIFWRIVFPLLGPMNATVGILTCVWAWNDFIMPLVVLTSNATREVSDALRRRCLHLFIDFPAPQEEAEVVKLRVPDLPERLVHKLVAMVHRLRGWELEKSPTLSETLDWARALVALGAESLDAELVRDTLSVILKTRRDLERGRKEVQNLLKA